MSLSSQLLWNYWSDFHETWYVDRTSYGVVHISRKVWSPHFCGSYVPWNLEMTLSLQLLWNYWSIYHETWYVDRTSYGVMHIGRKFWSPHFCGSYAPWNLEKICKSTNNLSFLCQFFINATQVQTSLGLTCFPLLVVAW